MARINPKQTPHITPIGVVDAALYLTANAPNVDMALRVKAIPIIAQNAMTM